MVVLTRHTLNWIVEIISYLFVLLFVYAAVSKLLDFENFQVQLGQSPLLSAYAGILSWLVPMVEIGIALMLAIPLLRIAGLYASYTLMAMFTAYIFIILNFSSFVPCSCGGVLEELGWKEHFFFNLGFLFLSLIALWLSSKNIRNSLLRFFILFLGGTATITALYIASEKAMHHENPFIRRFIEGSSYKIGETNLINNTQYFAGTDGSSIYFGDKLAPLYITAYDTTLKTKKHYKIQLEREDFPFRSVQVRIFPPYFYLMDGTVPVIYSGLISDWKGNLLMRPNGYYFSKAEPTAPNTIVFRAQEAASGENILGTFTFEDSLSVDYAPELLEKQIDGFFDTDGMLLYDSHSKKFVYAYYYRNEFIVANQNLALSYRGNTIDTTTQAKLKVAVLENGTRKIASPPHTINRLGAISGELLFINSTVIGQYEPEEMWKEASIVDVYDISNGSYLSSLYIYKVDRLKARSIFVVGNNLYALIGHQLHRYRLGKYFRKNDDIQ